MWVQLLTAYTLDVNGTTQHFQRGDWVDIGKQSARLLISRGQAHVPNYSQHDYRAEGAGLAAYGSGAKEALAALAGSSAGLPATELPSPFGPLPYERTLLWQASAPNAPLRRELLPVGFGLLDVWEAACPLWDYDTLAQEIGSDEERQRTRKITRDLRIPLFDCRLLYLRQSEGAERLLAQWASETKPGDNAMLAFLRAYYIAKPFMLALPVTWVNPAAGPA